MTTVDRSKLDIPDMRVAAAQTDPQKKRISAGSLRGDKAPDACLVLPVEAGFEKTVDFRIIEPRDIISADIIRLQFAKLQPL